MVQTIPERCSTIHHKQKSPEIHSLELKVFLKVYIDKNRTIRVENKIKDHLNFLFDEPVLFLVKENDTITLTYLDSMNLRYAIITLNDLSLMNSNSLVSLVILNNFNKKMLKILEIICNRTTNQSLLLI